MKLRELDLLASFRDLFQDFFLDLESIIELIILFSILLNRKRDIYLGE